MAVIVDVFTLGVKNAALAVAVDLDALFADLTNGIGLVGVRVDVKNRVGSVGGDRACGARASSSRVGARVGARERSTGNKRATDGENDSHGHGGGENSGHTKLQIGVSTALGNKSGWNLPGDNGPYGIIATGWFDDEPEQDVSDVDNPDGLS